MKTETFWAWDRRNPLYEEWAYKPVQGYPIGFSELPGEEFFVYENGPTYAAWTVRHAATGERIAIAHGFGPTRKAAIESAAALFAQYEPAYWRKMYDAGIEKIKAKRGLSPRFPRRETAR